MKAVEVGQFYTVLCMHSSFLDDWQQRYDAEHSVTRRFTRLDDYIAEVSNARVWAGFHYRNSTRVGEQMGRSLASYTIENYLQPTGLLAGK